MKPVLRVSALSCVCWVLPGLMACDQPRPKCTAAPGIFSATYTLLSSVGDCGDPLRGEELGVQVYYPPISASDQSPNYRRASIAIQPQQFTDLIEDAEKRQAAPDPADRPYAMGEFTTGEPGDDDLCRVPMPSIARLRLPALPVAEPDDCGEVAPAAPAVDISYTFNDVRVLVTPAATGTRLEANLTYQTNNCWATYRVAALYPVVDCSVPDDPDAGMNTDDECAPLPPAHADDALCGPGSQITPEFAAVCDPERLVCVLAPDASLSP